MGETCTPSPWCGGIMSKDAASSSLPAPLRAIVGVLTLALRAVQLVVATGLIYFIFCQGTMLAKEQKLIKKVPAIVNQGPHCSFVTQQGWHTKYPALGCHKRAFALRDLVKLAPALKWTPTDLAAMAEKQSPYGISDFLAIFTSRDSLI